MGNNKIHLELWTICFYCRFSYKVILT